MSAIPRARGQPSCEGEPANRARSFELLPTGDKAFLRVEDQAAKHTLFEGSIDACTPLASAQESEAMEGAIFSTVLAFIDAYLRDRAAAQTWLGSGDIETAGQGLFELDTK